MNTLLQNLMRRFMDEADDGSGSGSGSGGGGVDRGDSLDADAAAGNSAAGAQAEADLKALDKGAGTDGDDGDEQPRAKDGKFAKKDKGEVGIPKSRFDEAVNKEREAREAAERRAAEAEARLKQEEKSEDIKKLEDSVEGLEKQHAKLILDGEHEKAADVMKQIRLTERKIARMESEDTTSAATARAVEEVRVEAAVAKLQADHPQFNEDSDEFNPKLVNLVLAEQRRLMSEERMSPSKALLKAGADVMDMFSPKTKDSDDLKGLAAAARGEDRKARQVEKNLDTDKRQPASMKDSGLDSDKVGAGAATQNPVNMTREEWDALPSATKAKLRGDLG